jgi:hypothetical protein
VLELYKSRLRALGWGTVLVTRDVKRVGDASLYLMLYASNHPAGERIAIWSARNPGQDDQIRLL